MTRRLAAALALLLASTPAFAQRVDLRPRFEESQEFKFLLRQTTLQKTYPKDKPDEAVTYEIRHEIDLAFTVVTPQEKNDRAATLEMRIEGLRFEMDTAGSKMSFDSAKPDENGSLNHMLEPIIGAVFEIQIDSDGNIISLARQGQGSPSPFADQIIGTDILSSRLGPILTLKKGDGRASVGEYWTTLDEFENSPIGPHQLVTKHRLIKHRRRIAEIETTGRIIPKSEGATFPLNFEYTGTYLWDTRQGMLKSLEIESTLSTEITGADGAATTVETVSTLIVEQRE